MFNAESPRAQSRKCPRIFGVLCEPALKRRVFSQIACPARGAVVLFSEYRHKRRVQFYETDAAGIVHFSWYFRYMEEAELRAWREAG